MGNEEQETQQGAVRDAGRGDATGAARVQHVVLHGPADGRTMAAALRPAVERSRDAKGKAAPACLVITPTVEQALAAADQARTLFDDDTNRVVPVTAVMRARRVLDAGPVAVVSGTPHDLLALRRDSAVSLEALRAVVLVGLDELLNDGAETTLQALLADAPVDALRVATLDSETAVTDAFIEAHLRRARRVTPTVAGNSTFTVVPRYVVSTPAARAELLRAVLDEIDPPSVAIVATSDTGESDARHALARLGILVGDTVSVTRHAPAGAAALVVLWEAPAGAEALTEAVAGNPANALVFLLPDEVPSFHRLTGGAAQPWTPTVRKDSIESRTRTLRTALRSTLANGGASASELALLAPLLDSHDAIELAAAALRLYEGARREATASRTAASALPPGAPLRGAAASPAARVAPAAAPAPGSGARQRVFLAVGRRDGVQVGDIVGAVANEAGVDGSRIGNVELRDSHTTVEMDATDAARVVEVMGSVELKGRRLGARIDERSEPSGAYGSSRGGSARGSGRPERSAQGGGFGRDSRSPRGSDRSGSDRSGSDRGERGARPARSFGPPRDRGDRPAAGDRPSRPAFGGERGDRPARSSFGADRADRPARSSFGADRSDRPARSSFGADRSDRPARPGADGERGSRPARPAFGAARSDDRGAERSGGRPDRGASAGSSGGARSRSTFSSGRGEARPAEVRRTFNERPIGERVESKREWSSRAESLKNAKRGPRKPPGAFDER